MSGGVLQRGHPDVSRYTPGEHLFALTATRHGVMRSYAKVTAAEPAPLPGSMAQTMPPPNCRFAGKQRPPP